MNIKSKNNHKLSKFLSYVLRHKPDEIGIKLDAAGWVSVDELIAKSKKASMVFTFDELVQVVHDCEKQRYTLSGDKKKIRAAQGHSVEINLGLPTQVPPSMLFHGTASRFLKDIMLTGLLPQSRQHVHLSSNLETASQVGMRHGKLVILRIDSQTMAVDGLVFFQSDNGVWLTDAVPPKYISIQE